ncbi:MAG: hypothetical protein ACOZBL_02925 [Patescibacteria group bacterium]
MLSEKIDAIIIKEKNIPKDIYQVLHLSNFSQLYTLSSIYYNKNDKILTIEQNLNQYQDFFLSNLQINKFYLLPNDLLKYAIKLAFSLIYLEQIILVTTSQVSQQDSL